MSLISFPRLNQKIIYSYGLAIRALRQLLVEIFATMPFIKLIPERIGEIKVGVARPTIASMPLF